MIGMTKTFDEVRAIKVLVVPIGQNSMFESQYKTVAQTKSIPLYDMTRPSDWKKTCTLKNLNWDSGYIIYDYIRYDRIAHAHNELHNYQSSRRILMLIGLINYPEFNISEVNIESELNHYLRTYPTIILSKILVFNYVFDSTNIPITLSNDPEAVNILPPVGNCEGGSMIDVHLYEVLSISAVRIINTIDNQANVCEIHKNKNQIPTQLTSLSTHFDEIDVYADDASSKPKISYKKKPIGRLRKWMGDLAIQVCSPYDALEYYQQAMTELKSQNDLLWLAGANEGYALANYLQYKLYSEKLSNSLEASRVLKLIEDKVNDAILIYTKSVLYYLFEVEITIYLIKLIYEYNLVDRNQKILDYIYKVISIPGLSCLQQIECLLECNIILYQMGFDHKHYLFIYLASLLSIDNNQFDLAHSLMIKVCKLYGLSFITTNGSYDKIGYQISFTNSIDKPSIQFNNDVIKWSSIQMSLLAQTANISKEVGDIDTAARCVSAILRCYSSIEFDNRKNYFLWSNIHEAVKVQTLISKSNQIDPIILSEDTLKSRRHSVSVPEVTHSISNVSEVSSDLQSPSNRQSSTLSNELGKVSIIGNYFEGAHRRASTNITRANSSRSFSTFGSPMETDIPVYIPRSRFLTSPALEKISERNSSDNPGSISEGLVNSLRTANEGITSEFMNATEAIRQSVRQLAVPSITPKLIALMPSNKIKKQSSDEYSSVGNLFDNAPIQTSKRNHKPVIDSTIQPKRYLESISMLLDKISNNRDDIEQAYSMLDILTKKILPNTNILLPVYVTSVKPMQYLGSHLPVLIECNSIKSANNNLSRLATNSSASSTNIQSKSSLFYDPFAAKRAKKIEADKKIDIYWTVNTVSKLKIYLSNYLPIDITISNISLEIENKFSYRLYPINPFTIPASCIDYDVDVSIQPLECGDMIISSISLYVNNARMTIPLDDRGRALGHVLDKSSSIDINNYKTKKSDNNTVDNNSVTILPSDSIYTIVDIAGFQEEKLIDNSLDNKADEYTKYIVYEGEERLESIKLIQLSNHLNHSVKDFRLNCNYSTNEQSNNVLTIYPFSYLLKDTNSQVDIKVADNTNISIRNIDITIDQFTNNIDISFNWILTNISNITINIEIVTDSNSSINLLDMLNNQLVENIDLPAYPIKLFSRVYSKRYQIEYKKPIDIKFSYSPDITYSYQTSTNDIRREIVNDIGINDISLNIVDRFPNIYIKISNLLDHDVIVDIPNLSSVPLQLLAYSSTILIHIHSQILNQLIIKWCFKLESIIRSGEIIIPDIQLPTYITTLTSYGISMDITSKMIRCLDNIEVNEGPSLELSKYEKYQINTSITCQLLDTTRSEKYTVTVAIVILDKNNLSLSTILSTDRIDRHIESQLIPSHVLITGKLLDSYTINPSLDSITINHNMNIIFLKSNKYEIHICYKLELVDSKSTTTTNDNKQNNRKMSLSKKGLVSSSSRYNYQSKWFVNKEYYDVTIN